MVKSDNTSDSVGVRCGILAIILEIIAEVVFAPSGVWPFIATLALICAGFSGFLMSTILPTIAMLLTMLHFYILWDPLTGTYLKFMGIPYLFAITGIITGILRNRAQSQRIVAQPCNGADRKGAGHF